MKTIFRDQCKNYVQLRIDNYWLNYIFIRGDSYYKIDSVKEKAIGNYLVRTSNHSIRIEQRKFL